MKMFILEKGEEKKIKIIFTLLYRFFDLFKLQITTSDVILDVKYDPEPIFTLR